MRKIQNSNEKSISKIHKQISLDFDMTFRTSNKLKTFRAKYRDLLKFYNLLK